MDASAISGTVTASTYTPVTTTTTAEGQDFAAILASQTASTSGTASTGSAGADQALAAYSAGQQTAYLLQTDATSETDGTAIQETTETTDAAASTAATSSSDSTTASEESGETSEETSASGSTGFPAEVNAEWVPGRMQFYDESTGQWVDDNIPHRISESGDLEYYANGEWQLDAAIKHRMVDEEGNPIALVDEEGNPVGEETTASSEGTEGTESTTASEETSLQGQVYFNEELEAWKLLNLPMAVDRNGNRLYYWGDSWHSAGWQYRDASGSGVEVAGDPAGSAGVSSTASTSETDTGAGSTEQAA